MREAARRRVIEAEVRAVAGRLLDNPGAGPIADPLDALLRLAARLEAATDAVGEHVNGLGSLVGRGPGGGQAVRAELVIWTSLLGELRQTLTALARLDLDERLGRINAAQGNQIARAFHDVVAQVAGAFGGSAAARVEAHAAAVRVLQRLEAGEYAA